MDKEICCGAVVFTRVNGEIRYLLERTRRKIYGFPKGHMEAGETETQTALREIMEEVGVQVQLIDGFREVETYPVWNREGVLKDVVYFLAEYRDQTPVYQESELTAVGLYTYAEAETVLDFADRRRILKAADKYIKTHYPID